MGIPIILGQGRPSDNSPSIDRVVPAFGYVAGNVLVISMRANRIKTDAAVHELLTVANFYENLITTDWMKS